MSFLKKLLCKHESIKEAIKKYRLAIERGYMAATWARIQCTKCGKFKKITM